MAVRTAVGGGRGFGICVNAFAVAVAVPPQHELLEQEEREEAREHGRHHRFGGALFERVRQQFSEEELVQLSLAVVAINGWNRLNVAARTVPGDYVPGSVAKLQTVS